MSIKKVVAVLLAVCLVGTMLAGCGIVKIIPKGEEAKYTGVEVFDANAEAAGDWELIRKEVVGAAAAFKGVLDSASSGSSYCVSFEAKVSEYNTDSPKGYLLVNTDGIDVRVQVGKVFSGTAVRDCQTNKVYGDFTNQTEWSAYAKTINAQVLENVVTPLGDLSALVGKTITVIGCFTPGDPIVVTPVSITVQ